MAESRQDLWLIGREKLNIKGALKIEDFDQNTVCVETVLGSLVIRGEDLHIEELLLEEEKLSLSGNIRSVSFDEGKNGRKKRSSGFRERLSR